MVGFLRRTGITSRDPLDPLIDRRSFERSRTRANRRLCYCAPELAIVTETWRAAPLTLVGCEVDSLRNRELERLFPLP